MTNFKELIEGTITIDVSNLQDTYNDPDYEKTDFEFMMDELEEYGLKEKDWYYDGDNVVIPSKYKKYIIPWDAKVVK